MLFSLCCFINQALSIDGFLTRRLGWVGTCWPGAQGAGPPAVALASKPPHREVMEATEDGERGRGALGLGLGGQGFGDSGALGRVAAGGTPCTKVWRGAAGQEAVKRELANRPGLEGPSRAPRDGVGAG